MTDHFSGGEKIKIRKSVAKDITARYQKGWEFIRQHYFPKQKTLFHMDFSMYDGERPSQHFGTEEAILVSLTLMEDILQKRSKQS